ncbi:MAG: response regulator [Deltaproteobacteria bacterium]|nr:response regulator [Deltaproteobacteria bacterium]
MSYIMPRILVVDDEPRMCDSVKILLADRGYEIKTSSCGEEAITHVTNQNFDLVLLDVVMPGMDGYQVMDYLKRHHPELLIIMMTGNASVDSAVGALRRGAYDYLSKPFSHEGLLKRVENALEQKRSKIEKEIISKKLELSEARYRYLVQNSPDIIFILSPEGEFRFINNTVEHLLGYESAGLIGRHFTSIVADDCRSMANRYLQEIGKNGRMTEHPELRLRHNLGRDNHDFLSKKRLIVELRAAQLPDIIDDENGNGKPGIYGIARDITASKQASEALRISEEKYSTILEDIEEGYYETDLDGNFTFFNQSFHKTFGYSRSELMGMNKSQCMDPRCAQKALQATRDVYITGRPAVGLEWECSRKDGTRIVIDTSVFLTKNSEGQATGFRGIIRNITERKRLESDLLQAQKMEAVGTLAGGIAHDFNNLLMGIHGYASLMLMTIKPNNPDYEKLKSIEQHVQSGAELTRQLLGFARGGKYEVKPTRLNDLIGKSITLFGRTKKELIMHQKLREDLWTAEVDRGQIEQVLLNLYLNAWQAMPGGGSIYIETDNVTIENTKAMPFYVTPGTYVKISVADTGVGMDEKTLERLFEPFFTTKEMGRGTGLGLASAYGIIKGHGGFINVSSQLEKGTIFDIYIPSTVKEVIEEEAPSCDITKGHETILLVDDEEAIINVTRDILEMLGYKVITASSGQEAIDTYSAKKDSLDLVILDMIMPGMGGGETFDRLKEINPDIKVILSSGYSITGRATKIMERGCRSFIQKPFNINEISSRIREALDKQ